MEKFSLLLTRWFIKKNVLPAEDEELYAYAVSCLFITVSPLLLALVIGACMDLFLEGIALMIPFMILRSFGGGMHLESPGKCFAISAGIIAVLLFLTTVIPNSYTLRMFMLASGFSLMVFSPIENVNKPLRIHERKVYKKIIIIWVLIFWVTYCILSFLRIDRYSICIACGMILTAVLQVPCLGSKWRE